MFTRLILSIVLVAAAAFLSTPAQAVSVTLDGVANATWSANPTTYLYVVDKSDPTKTPYFSWNYGVGSLPAAWTSLDAMVNSLLFAQYVGTNDWKVESGGNPFHPGSVFQTLTLPAGVYTLKLAQNSEAYNLQGYQWPNETLHQDVWNAYVQIYAVYQDNKGTASLAFGGFNDWQTTESGALAYYRSQVDGLRLILDYPATVNFYINDWNSVDNTQSVSLDIHGVPIPGALTLLGSGLLLLAAGRQWRRHRNK